MNRYPLWQYIVLAIVFVIALLYTLPNMFGQQPTVRVSGVNGKSVSASIIPKVKKTLSDKNLPYQSVSVSDKGVLKVGFDQSDAQLRAIKVLDRALGDDFVTAPALSPLTPAWLQAIGAKPMSLGLDLRGGVYFLLKVDMDALLNKTYKGYSRDLPHYLRSKSIRYSRSMQAGHGVKLRFPNTQSRKDALAALGSKFPNLQFTSQRDGSNTVVATLTDDQKQHIHDFAMKQNLTTLRNRINELGVAQPLIQRQGTNHIVVELPGVQNTAEAKRLLGKTATLEYRLVAQGHDPAKAAKSGIAPPGTELFYTRDDHRPILLDEDIIASGDQLVDAAAGFDQRSGTPDVNVTLNGAAAKKMFKVTEHHVGDPMAVLFIENRPVTKFVDGKEVHTSKTTKKVISVATIQGVFGKRFQTTGLKTNEAHELALLLRAGALAAPMQVVGERIIGPSLGADNIHKGEMAVVLAFALVILFMAVYYGMAGVLADLALFLNLLIILAAMSLIQATLTMPGIAGIVLTLGMAVDANVLIIERMREELDAGNSPQAVIHKGYDRAFSAIADGHLTTLLAGIVLFMFGTGPIKGFAVTLSIGVVASLYTSVIGTRALTNLLYGRKKHLKKVSLG